MTRAEAIDYLKPIAESASMKHYRVALNKAIEALREEKAPEIIRCKDCAFLCPGNVYPVCTNWGRNTDLNGWCYMAERKDGGG